jgi:hypothetical protein
MSYRGFALTAAVVVLGVAVLVAPPPALGQAALAPAPAAKTAPAAKAYTPPRTPDGHTDFQGVWTNNTVTPLVRPKGLAGKEFYTEEEMQANEKKERERLDLNLEDGRPTEPGTAADVHYDFAQFGLDRAQAKLVWARRTSLIVGPEGTIPPLTPEARKRVADINAKNKGHELDGPENRPIGARCIARPNVGPPLLPAAYNSNLQIVQGAGYIAIEAEMIHDTRVIPTDGRSHISSSVRQWMGDSVGHWEGDTLVIDTTNFTDLNPFPGAQNLHVVERLRRVDPETILYGFTVEDPGMWTKPWSGEVVITKIQGNLYEYACHEANYPLANTLRGARVAEEQAAAKKAAK